MFTDLPQTLSTSFEHTDFVQDAWSHITATGHMHDLNVAVSGLLFVPTNNFNVINGGLATVMLTITDIEASRLLQVSMRHVILKRLAELPFL